MVSRGTTVIILKSLIKLLIPYDWHQWCGLPRTLEFSVGSVSLHVSVDNCLNVVFLKEALEQD